MNSDQSTVVSLGTPRRVEYIEFATKNDDNLCLGVSTTVHYKIPSSCSPHKPPENLGSYRAFFNEKEIYIN